MLARRLPLSPLATRSAASADPPPVQVWLARAVTVVVAVAALLAGVRVVLQSLAFLEGDLIELWGLRVVLDPLALPAASRVTWASIGVLLVLVSGALLWIGAGGTRSKERWFVLAQRGEGLRGASTISISGRAAEALVAEAANRVTGVWEAHPRLGLGRKGWKLDLVLFIRRDVAIPETSGEVEHEVAEALRSHTGIGPARIRIRAELGPYERDWS